MSETILRTSGLVRRFPVGSGDEITVLNNINIEIPKGKLIIIKGRSGSGKTTLLNILSALDTASEGEVVLKTMSADGEEEENVYSRLSDNARDRLRRNHMGFVFQSVALVPIMTAYENVDFGLRTAGYKGSRRERIVESLASVGLEERMKHMPAQLSGGEQQRVAIARAMAHRPEIIFADEPTGALDSQSSADLLRVFEKMNKAGQTILMVTHSTDAASHANRVLFIRDGVVFHQIYRGEASNEELYQKISDTLTMLRKGGEAR